MIVSSSQSIVSITDPSQATIIIVDDDGKQIKNIVIAIYVFR